MMFSGSDVTSGDPVLHGFFCLFPVLSLSRVVFSGLDGVLTDPFSHGFFFLIFLVLEVVSTLRFFGEFLRMRFPTVGTFSGIRPMALVHGHGHVKNVPASGASSLLPACFGG